MIEGDAVEVSPQNAGDAERRRQGRHVTCPTCHALAPWLGNAHRPFCSLACRLIDLGGWLDERYRIPGADSSLDPPDVP
jgi:uncharacterized protein